MCLLTFKIFSSSEIVSLFIFVAHFFLFKEFFIYCAHGSLWVTEAASMFSRSVVFASFL